MSIENYKVTTRPAARPASMVQGENYRFTILTPSLIRMEYAPDGVFEDRATQAVWFRDFDTPQFQVEDSGEELVIYTEALEVHYNRKPFAANGLSVNVKGITLGNNCTWHFGEEPSDLLGTARTLDLADGTDLINPAEFYNASPMHAADGGKLPMEHGILSRMGFSWFDDSRTMVLLEDGWIDARKPGNTDLYFFGYGHRYLEALKDFYHLCGKTPLLPRYALGNWWSRYYRYSEESYKTLISRFEKEKLPFSVSVVDMDWHLVDDVDPKYGSGWTGYTWNPKLFPDPKGFMEWLHAHNLRITLNVHPADGVRAFEKLYPQMAEAMGIDPATEQPVECDLADRKFMEAYFEKLHHPLEEEGVDFWWIDWQQGGVTKVPGLDPLWMLNHYHYQDSTWKGNRGLTFSRFAGVGSHRYPIGFSGDTVISWKSLDFQPYFTATASNIGYGWWSHDIGGHMLGTRDNELTARWVQLGVFSPINRLHSSDNPFSGKEPWKYGLEAGTVMSNFLRLRHELVPYLYSMNHRAHYDDLPLIWPLYYAEPENQEAYFKPNEFYFGSELLVSPITKPQDPEVRMAEAETWIPEGIWVDFFNGRVYDGNKRLSLWRSLAEYPVLMKAGAIVPMKDLTEFDNSTDNPKAMTVKVFPAASGSFTLWEDAGDTPTPAEEDWASTGLSVDGANGTFTIAPVVGNVGVIPEMRSWKLQFMAVEKPEGLENGSGATQRMRDELNGDGDVAQNERDGLNGDAGAAQGEYDELKGDGNAAMDARNARMRRPEVFVDGKLCSCAMEYEDATGILTVTIPEVSVNAKIFIHFPGGFAIRKNPVEDICFDILQNAYMEYEMKRPVYHFLCSKPKHAEAQLNAMKLPNSVRSALIEVIAAQD